MCVHLWLVVGGSVVGRAQIGFCERGFVSTLVPSFGGGGHNSEAGEPTSAGSSFGASELKANKGRRVAAPANLARHLLRQREPESDVRTAVGRETALCQQHCGPVASVRARARARLRMRSVASGAGEQRPLPVQPVSGLALRLCFSISLIARLGRYLYAHTNC